VAGKAAAGHAHSRGALGQTAEVSPPSEPGLQGQAAVDDPTKAAGPRLGGAEPCLRALSLGNPPGDRRRLPVMAPVRDSRVRGRRCAGQSSAHEQDEQLADQRRTQAGR
jgi:hypothetical protein